jgi:hypothetical protein
MSELGTHLDEVALRRLPASVDGCEECLRDGGATSRRSHSFLTAFAARHAFRPRRS